VKQDAWWLVRGTVYVGVILQPISEGKATEYASGVLGRLLVAVPAKGALQMMTGVRVK